MYFTVTRCASLRASLGEVWQQKSGGTSLAALVCSLSSEVFVRSLRLKRQIQRQIKV